MGSDYGVIPPPDGQVGRFAAGAIKKSPPQKMSNIGEFILKILICFYHMFNPETLLKIRMLFVLQNNVYSLNYKGKCLFVHEKPF